MNTYTAEELAQLLEISIARAEILVERGLCTYDALSKISKEELAEINGIGIKCAEKIKSNLEKLRERNGNGNGKLGKDIKERWKRVGESDKEVFETKEVKELEEAYRYYDELTRIQPELPKAWEIKGEILAKLSRYSEACVCFEKAAALAKEGEVYKRRILEIIAERESGKKKRDVLRELLERYDALLAKQPRNPDLLKTKAEILRQMGETEKAEAVLSTIHAIEKSKEAKVVHTPKGIVSKSPFAEGARSENGITNGKINGRINGKINGRINGKTNGKSVQGLINGRTLHYKPGKINGLINGVATGRGATYGKVNGLINGFVMAHREGLINGAGLKYDIGKPKKKKGVPESVKKTWTVVIVFFMFFLLPLLIYSMFVIYPGITIDGKFEDWEGTTIYENPVYSLQNPSVEIGKYGVHLYRNYLSFYVEVRDAAMLGKAFNETDAFFMFVDADDNASTGYAISGIGADYMAVFSGWDCAVKSASAYQWNSSRNQTDFNGFESKYSGKGAVDGQRFEGQFTLTQPASIPRIVFYAQDNYGNRSRGQAVVSTHPGAIVITQSNPQHGIVNHSQNVELLRLSVETKAKENWIRQINVSIAGNASATDFDGIELRAGNNVVAGNYTDGMFRFNVSMPLEKNSEMEIGIYARLNSSAIGKSVGLRIPSRSDVFVKNGTATLYSSFIGNTYVETVPQEIVIDGAFADWQNVMLNTDTENDTFPPGRFVWPSVDIAKYGMVDMENVSFYLSTYGVVLAGEELPMIVERPSEVVTPPPPEVPVLEGMDALFVFIDIDGNRLTGFRVYRGEMGAEYMIMVTGKNNTIYTSEVYHYETYIVEQNWTYWTYMGNVSAAIGSHEMECALPRGILQDIGNRSVIRFATKNWFKAGDWSDSALITNLMRERIGVRNTYGTDVVINEIYTYGSNDWIEIVNPTENPIDISGWDILLGNTVIYTFPSGTIIGAFGSGNEYLVVTFTTNPFPSNSRTVRIQDQTNTRTDQTRYPANLGAGQTWARYYSPYNGKPVDTDTDSHDFYISDSPTQRQRNDRALPIDNHLVINEVSTSGNWIEIANPTSSQIDVRNWYLQARIGNNWRTVYTFQGTNIIGAFGSGSEYRVVTPTTNIATATGVRLYTNTGTLIDEVQFTTIPSGATLSRYKNAYDGKPEDTDVDTWDFYISSSPTSGTWNDRKAPLINVVKIADKQIILSPGEYVNYTIYYNNTGDGRARNVWVNDTLSPYLEFVSASPAPSGIAGKTYYWNFTNLAPGSYSITFTARVNESIPPTTTIYNNVSVNYTDILGRKMPESIYSCAILYNAPYIVVGKIVDRETASPGDWLNYTVYYNNTGSANSKYVWINDTLPDYVTFVTSSIPYNSTDGRTYKWVLENVSVGMNALTITVRINTTAPTGITITNSVSLNYTDAAGNKLQNSSAFANTSVIGAFALIVINEISSYPNPEWIEIANPTDSSVNIGGWYIYRGTTRIYTFPTGTVLGPFGSGSEYLSVSLSNQLPDTGAIITLRRTATEIIDETTYPRMDSGESWARFKHEDTGRPIDTNTSSDFYISSSPTRNAPNDRKAPYIAVDKIADVSETQPGSQIIYTIYYNNTGDGNAKEVWINDTLPDGVAFVSSSIPYTSTDGRTYRWYFGTVVHDSQNALTITVQVNATVGDGVTLTNIVNLTYKDQLRRSMPSSQASAQVLCRRPIILVEKVVDKTVASYGEILTYTIYYNNTGTGIAGHVWINDTLPDGVDFVSASDGGVLDGNVVRWHFTNVAPGSHYVTLQVSVNVTQGTLMNWAFLNYTSLYGVKFQESSDSANTTVVPETSWHYSMLGVLVLVTVNVLKRKYGGVKNDKKTGSWKK
ncbi:MAG: lamin tail domain-containing protein [Thermoplasmata archaeon]